MKKPGLASQLKDKIIQQTLQRQLQQTQTVQPRLQPADDIPPQFYQFHQHPGYQQLQIMHNGAAKLGLQNPFFKVHQATAGASTLIDGRSLINYASYNYLGLSGHPQVNAAAKAAIDQYGTSVSASRPVSGERPVHRALEQKLAQLYQVDDAIVFVSGHATNVSTIGYLFGPRDLILHDELVHNSILQGIQLSGAKRLPFAHNDYQQLSQLLQLHRRQFERVLIVVEGIYSMDGDYPDLPKFVELKQQHRCFLMVDEAHSFGVMGATGLGIREHFGLAGHDVDIWMGTLSKSLAACGGYIAGSLALIEHLKFLAPGFLYSVGMSPPVAAAALAALELLVQQPQRVQRLQQQGQLFLQHAKAAGINTGSSTGLAVVPALCGGSIQATRLSAAMLEQGISVQPILYPAVPENSARLRFFISCDHQDADLHYSVQTLQRLLAK